MSREEEAEEEKKKPNPQSEIFAVHDAKRRVVKRAFFMQPRAPAKKPWYRLIFIRRIKKRKTEKE